MNKVLIRTIYSMFSYIHSNFSLCDRMYIEYDDPNTQEFSSQQLAHEPDALNIDSLPTISRSQFVEGPL